MPSDSTPKRSPESYSETLFEDAELVNTNTGKTTPSKPPDPYIYYRVYTEDGAIYSKSPVYTDDPYLARIWVRQVAPPRTPASLKRCLSAVECLGSSHDGITLFTSAKSEGPVEDMSAGFVSLTHDTGTPEDPIILFVKEVIGEHGRLGVSKPEAILLPPREGATPFKEEFLYYRIYTEDGAIPSKQPTNSSDLSLGRIDVNTITPPRTANTIKQRIAKAEQLRRQASSKLFKNMESTTPMDAAEVLVLGEVDRLGLSEEDPMVYVHSSTAQYKVIQTASWLSEGYPKWLDITAGEILYMELENSVATRQIYGSVCYEAYKLVNNTGASGYVYKGYILKVD